MEGMAGKFTTSHCRSYAIKPYHVTFYKERVLPTQSNKYHVCIGTVISVGTLSEQFWVFLFICPEKLFIIRPFTKFGKKNLFLLESSGTLCAAACLFAYARSALSRHPIVTPHHSGI
jgi:hypothetical protein